MRLAGEPITIMINGEAATLRPSLRAAYRLETKHGLTAVFQGIVDGNLSIITDLIAIAGDSNHLPALLRNIGANGARILDRLRPALLEYLATLFSTGDDKPDDEHGERMPVATYLEQLFELATGWLGWTPAVAWAATPAEILAAHRGHIAKLKVIYGTAEGTGRNEGPSTGSSDYDPLDLPSDDEVRAGAARLKELASQRIGGRP